ncbi:MAG: NAD(P)H-dependent oxidoreductase [Betaproteobacteria bacterium]
MAFAPNQTVVVLGTSRDDGNTRRAVDEVIAGRPIEIVSLSQFNFSPYDYQHRNTNDGFIQLIESIVDKPFWILATPVYWYSMSAQLKVFVDRQTDLITVRKDLGRRLRGKSVAVLASGTDPELPEGFEAPFQLTCGDLGMSYLGASYHQFEKNDAPILNPRMRPVTWLS